MSDPFERYYQVLGLEPGASWEEVNQAYKDLAFVWHPDRLPKDNPRLLEKAAERLKAINEAREQLRARRRTAPAQAQPSNPRPNYYDPKAANQRSQRAYQRPTSSYGSYGYTARDRQPPPRDRTASNNRQPPPSDRAQRPDPKPPPSDRAQRPDPKPPPRYDAKTANGNGTGASTPPPRSSPPPRPSPPPRSSPRPDPGSPNHYRPFYRDMSGIDLKGADLREKDLSGRNLQNANLQAADLADSFLHGVNLEGADLSQANLFRANLLQANLRNANLEGANLVGADFSGADLSGANLRNAKMLSGNRLLAKLTGARLSGTTFPDGTTNA